MAVAQQFAGISPSPPLPGPVILTKRKARTSPAPQADLRWRRPVAAGADDKPRGRPPSRAAPRRTGT